MKIILASASERRKELLTRITENFEVIVSDFDESTISFDNNCEEYVINLAKGKAFNILERLKEHSLVIACDTIVYSEGKVLGKPKNEEDAIIMLKMLSNKTHKVYSGIVVLDTKTNNMKFDAVCTEVKFSELSDEAIEKYVKTGDPLDKAGAYGIQGRAATFVEGINGCYYNVVGLPLNRLNTLLMEMGVNL